MRPTLRGLAVALALGVPCAAYIASAAVLVEENTRDSDLYKILSKPRISFETNQGQAPETVKFVARGARFAVLLAPTVNILRLSRTASGAAPETEGLQRRATNKGTQTAEVQMRLTGANPEAKMSGMDELVLRSNYFVGQDPARWTTAVENFARLKEEDVYPGIDLFYHGAGGVLEYDFVLAPGANPARIELLFDGVTLSSLDSSGNVRLETPVGDLTLRMPVAFQEHDGTRTPVAIRYQMTGTNRVGFAVGAYDPMKSLTIDPVLDYNEYWVRGDPQYGGNAIAMDVAGELYVVGAASVQSSGSNPAAFVLRFSSLGVPLYVTYLGGLNLNAHDGAWAVSVALDRAGNAYVTGGTTSSDFPVLNAPQPAYGGTGDPNHGYWGDAFVAKLDPRGRLVYSTFLGGPGADIGNAIAVDAHGSAFIAGNGDFPGFPTVGQLPAFVTGQTGFVAKLSPDGRTFAFAMGLGFGTANAIALDPQDNPIVGGGMINALLVPDSSGGLMRAGEVIGTDPTVTASSAYLFKLNNAGTSFIYRKALPGPQLNAEVRGIAIDTDGNAFITGTSPPDLIMKNMLQPFGGSDSEDWDAFVAKVLADGSDYYYATYLGGNQADAGNAIAIDREGNAYVFGVTESSDFPQVAALDGLSADGPLFRPFVAKINSDGRALIYATELPLSSSANLLWWFVDGNSNAIAVRDCSQTAYLTTPDQVLAALAFGPPWSYLHLSATQLWFFNQPLGVASTPQVVTLVNACDAPVKITDITITPDFREADTCVARPITLNPGDSCRLYVQFVPTQAGFRSGHITITDSADGSPQTIALNGYGPSIVDPICKLKPLACRGPNAMSKESLQLLCDRLPCRVLDPVEANCRQKWGNCPRCPPGAPCPGFLEATFEGLGQAWDVRLVDAHGKKLAYSKKRTEDRTVIGFRPDRDHYIRGQLSSYFFIFDLGTKGKLGRPYEIKTSLKVSDRPQ